MISIKIPASTSNLAAGFDVFGLALKLYLTVKAEKCAGTVQKVSFVGEGSELITKSNSQNYITFALEIMFKDRGLPVPGYKIHVKNEIPVSRGLGSSGTAIIAGVVAANYLGGLKLSDQELLDEAIKIEGHPDNICPSFVGGLTAAMQTEDGNAEYLKQRFPNELSLVFVIPEIHVSTKKARGILPGKYGIKDIVFNLQRASLVLESFRRKKFELLSHILKDKLHQPYRAGLVPGMGDILKLKPEKGLVGLFISGSGPTVCALATHDEDKIAQKIVRIFSDNRLQSKYYILQSDNAGTRVSIKK